MPIVAPPPIAPIEPDLFDDDDEGWQDMPVIKDDDDMALGLDEEDRKKYHYVPPAKQETKGGGNATGNVLDVDYLGDEWRAKVDQNENEYTRLRVNEEDESDEVHMRTKYLFDEDKAMTPLSQMQTTKDLLTEAQRIAYVGLCALSSREMADKMKAVNRKELKKAIENMELWALKIMGRLYYHMELTTEEQKMIDSLAMHGIEAKDLVPALMTTHTVANPEYDPAEARRRAEEREVAETARLEEMENESTDVSESVSTLQPPSTPKPASQSNTPTLKQIQTTARVLEDSTSSVPGVSTHLSAADENVTLDIRWTVLCDLFLVLIADSVYDARSRVLLETVAFKLGLGWLDVVRFERRVTEALEIEEGVEQLEQEQAIKDVQKSTRKRRYMMLGLATLGGGLVIGLSAGLLAPVIGAGLGAALTTVGITGTTGFLAGTAGAAVITTGGVLTGSGLAVRGMANRTRYVRTFDILPLHNSRRVNCILTVSGFMTGAHDDVRLPFSVLDPVVGDVFSVLWEPEMIRETGSALKILTTEVLTQLAQTALQATVMTALMSALQWPIILTKLGYLIDNPWSNALDRARSAGRVLADVLLHRHLGVRPMTLIGFSLGARVIFYALLELAKAKAFGIVQDVILLGATVTAPLRAWLEVRSVISGRFVNGYARNDWVLNYLFRATSGGLNTVAGLRAVENVPGLENVDVTDKIAGHMSYRTFMPLILDQLGFPVSADYFDEPVEPDFTEDRIVVREGDEDLKKKSWFSRRKKKSIPAARVSRPPSATSVSFHRKAGSSQSTLVDDDLPPRENTASPKPPTTPRPGTPTSQTTVTADRASSTDIHDEDVSTAELPVHAGFNFEAIKEVIGKAELNPTETRVPASLAHHEPTQRSESVPLPSPPLEHPEATPIPLSSLEIGSVEEQDEPVAGPSSFTRSDLVARTRSLDLSHGEDEEELPAISRTPSNTFDVSSFGSRNNAQWPAREPEDEAHSFGGFGGSRTAPGRDAFTSRDTLFPGKQASSSLGSSSFGSYQLTPFSPHSSLPPQPDSSLAFGGIDGSITLSPIGMEPDPWAARSGEERKKYTSTFDLNPWQS